MKSIGFRVIPERLNLAMLSRGALTLRHTVAGTPDGSAHVDN
jgi:hypothetical protein